MKRTSCTNDSPKKLQLFNNYIWKEKKSMNPTTEHASMWPKLQDHSNNDLTNIDFSSMIESFTWLKVQLFHSLHNIHIKQKRTTIQIKV